METFYIDNITKKVVYVVSYAHIFEFTDFTFLIYIINTKFLLIHYFLCEMAASGFVLLSILSDNSK